MVTKPVAWPVIAVSLMTVFIASGLSLAEAEATPGHHQLLHRPHQPRLHRSHSRYGSAASLTQQHRNDINYKTLYISQQVDHFGFVNKDTYQQRYLLADQFWDQNNGPIFFYTGNEGDIAWFCNNTGAMWDWAPEFKALLVFAEHRYYGESLPYGNNSYKDLDHLGYLSAEQALADFTVLITHLRDTLPGAADRPVIAFGGSYGGMLAAWFRIKYPHIVQGALSASAPVWMFGDLVPCESFLQTVTNDFRKSSAYCAENIARSWAAINTQGKTEAGRSSLTKTFSLCDPLTSSADADGLKAWLSDVYTNLGMVDYPYAASFLEPLPAWPINVVCAPLSHKELYDNDLLTALSEGIKVYYNYTGHSKCLNIKQQATGDLGDLGWGFQACTEMVMPTCSDGKNDMFEPSPWDFPAVSKACQKTWGVTPRPDWILEQFGGKQITTASNIIFSNGDLDPWHVGGVLTSLSSSLIAIEVPNGAHHLDLRGATPQDPPSLTAVREQEKQIIKGWLEDIRTKKLLYLFDDEINEEGIYESMAADNDAYIAVMVLLIAAIFIFYFVMSRKMEKLLSRYVWKSTVNSTDVIVLNTDDDDDDKMLMAAEEKLHGFDDVEQKEYLVKM